MASPIRVSRASDGALLYAVALPPEGMPPVAPGALLEAWALARRGAALHRWGPPRVLVFPPPRPADGAADLTEPTRIAIADADAGCWAEAIDAAVGLDTLPGLSLCLRLLALVEVLGRAAWLDGMFDVTNDGIDLHPALLQAAAAMPLDAEARLDEDGLRRRLARPLPTQAPSPRLPA